MKISSIAYSQKETCFLLQVKGTHFNNTHKRNQISL